VLRNTEIEDGMTTMRMFLAAAASVCIAAAALFAATPKLQPLPDGVWRTEGYGFVFKVGAGKLAIFDETKEGCLLNGVLEGTQADEWAGTVAVEAGGSRATLHAGISRIAVTRLDALPERCKPRPQDPTPLANFDHLWQTFAEHYAFFETRGVDWNAARAEFRPQAAAAKSPEQLFEILSTMLGRLKDAHVSLNAGETEFKAERSPAPSAAGPEGIVPTRKGLQRALKDYVSGPATPLLKPAAPLGRNRVWVGELKGKIGYVAVFAMGGFDADDAAGPAQTKSARAVFQEVANAFKDMRGVIVDLRYNQGGYDSVSLELAGLFAAKTGVAFKKRAHGTSQPAYAVPLTPASPLRLAVPVAVLVSEHTVSAGETAATAFRTLPNATLIGQPTQGALSDVLEKALPNGWRFTLSNEVFETADGTTPEGKGIAPHVATAVPAAPKTPAERFQPDIDEAVRILTR
jgi:hypothetical protein